MQRSFRKMKSWWISCTLLAFSAVFGEEMGVKENKMLYSRSGNVSIIGLFNSFSGNGCTTEVAKGLEETAAAIWTVEALNNFHYLPGVTIGISIFDACHFLNSQKNFLRITEDAQINGSTVNVGFLTSEETYKKLPNFENSTLKVAQLNHVVDPRLLVESTLELVLNLQWVSLRAFVSDSPDILNLFRERVAEEIIEVVDYLLINERDLNLEKRAAGDDETASVMVVIAAFDNISCIGERMLNFKLIITPTDFTFDLTGFPNGTIVLLPSMESKSVLSKYIKSTARYKNFFSHKGPTKSPLFIGTAVNILKLLKPVKNLLDERCGNVNSHSHRPCAESVNFTRELRGNETGFEGPGKISPDDILETLNVLKIKPNFNDEMFLYIASVLNANVSEDLSIFKIFSLQTKKFAPVLLKINDNLVRSGEIFGKPGGGIKHIGRIFEADPGETKEFPNSLIRLSQKLPPEGSFPAENVRNVTAADCDNEVECRNFDRYPKSPNGTAAPALGWRFLTWVCINTALAFTGVTCTLSLMLFVFIRVLKGDAIESSLSFNLLLMASVVLVYCSSLLFHVEYLVDNRLLCFFRMKVPPVVCAVLFSLLLSRSLMLAFNEYDSHINGYLHAILCIFMISLQVSVTVQTGNYETVGGNCSGAHDQYRLIIALSYNFILLIFLACASPFIVCSKRNNKEGLLISVSVFFITVVWSTWICFYVLFSNNYKDAAVAVGLNSTATVVVLCIFIPRTYFVTVPTVQDSTVCYIPTLGKLTDNLTIHGQSSQALNDSPVGAISYKNCELGTSNPNFYAGRTDEGSRVGIRESAVDLSSENGQ